MTKGDVCSELEEYRRLLNEKKSELDWARYEAYVVALSGNFELTNELIKYLEKLGKELLINLSEDVRQIRRILASRN